MTDPLAPDDLERRLRAALARRAARADRPMADGDLDAGLDDLGRRIGAPAATSTRPDPAEALVPVSPEDTVIPLPATADRPDHGSRARLAAAACVVAVLGIGALGLATAMSDGRSAPLAVSAIEVPTTPPGGSDVLTVAVTKGPFAGLEAEVAPVPLQVRDGAATVRVEVVLTNPTGTTIEGPGCPFASSRFGLATSTLAEPEKWQESIGSCAVTRSRFEPGSRTSMAWTVDLDAAQGRDDTEYRIVIESEDDALHLEVPIHVDRGSRTTVGTTPTTAASIPTTTAPAGIEGGLAEHPSSGESTPADRGARYTELDGLVLQLELDRYDVAGGDTIQATVVVANPTEHDVTLTECTVSELYTGVVPPDDPDARLLDPGLFDCSATTAVIVRAGSQERVAVPRLLVARSVNEGEVPSHLGDLAPGRYDAVVIVPGSTSEVRLEVPIDVRAGSCPGVTDEMVRGYVGRTEARAKAFAATQGRIAQVVQIDGQALAATADLRCDRVDLTLVDGKVTDISLG